MCNGILEGRVLVGLNHHVNVQEQDMRRFGRPRKLRNASKRLFTRQRIDGHAKEVVSFVVGSYAH